MPTKRTVTPGNMNYAVVYFVGILVFSAIYWFAHGRKYYSGPLKEARADDEPARKEGGGMV
jgi:hypothetical protein